MVKSRILFISGREVGYIRNRVLLDALQKHGDVSVWTPRLRSTVGRLAWGTARLAVRRPDYDVGFVGFYGQPLAIAMSALQRRPFIFDAYLSTFDTLCEDRRWFRPRSAAGALARWLDRQSCLAADRVLTDTEAHKTYFTETFALPAERFDVVYVGCDESIFFPVDGTADPSGRIDVFYYGSFLPLHGTEVIVEAANLLRNRPGIHFTIGGGGPGLNSIRQRVEVLGLKNVELTGWIPLTDLPAYIARAAICLGGHFSTVPKASRVISTKTFQFIAMRRATIVGDNAATREMLLPGRDVYAVSMGSPAALAEAVQVLADDEALREQMAAAGYEAYRDRLSMRAVARRIGLVLAHVGK